MTNSDRFYQAASNFQSERKSVVDKYEKKMAELKRMEGSEYYKEESKKAEDDKKKSLDSLIASYGDSMKTCMSDMKRTNSKRILAAPSEEQLRLLTVLKMKEVLTQEEVLAAANSFSDNSVCLSVLHELADKNNIHANIFENSKNLPMAMVEHIIDSAEASITDFLQYDTSKAARIAAIHNERLYGTPFSESELPKRNLFTSKSECFAELFGMNGTAFYDAVD